MNERVSDLLPCKKCGSDHTSQMCPGGDWHVECCDCGYITSGAHRSRAEAVAAWNRRSAASVGVKPLGWARDGNAWISIMFWGLRYRIHETPSGKFILRDPLNGPQFFDTLEQAKAAAPQPPQPVKVDDAMVERAMAAEDALRVPFASHDHAGGRHDFRCKVMRAALTAALSHEGEAK